MPAYMIAELKITDESWRAEYGPKVQELTTKHGGKPIARGVPDSKLEGDRALPDGLVIVEFPSLEQAKAWYNDPEYAPMIKLRQTGAITEITLIDGV